MEYFTQKEIEILQSLVTKSLNNGSIFVVKDGEFIQIDAGKEGQVLTIINGIPTWK